MSDRNFIVRMSDRRYLLDVDGVARNFIAPYLGALNLITGGDYTLDHIEDWKFESLLEHGVDPEHIKEAFDRMGDPGVVLHHPLYAGAREGVARLQQLGDVYAVTAPLAGSATWEHESTLWITERLGIPHKNVISTEAKHVCAGDFFVEDKVEMLEEWSQHNKYGRGVLFRRTHNRRDWAAWNGATVDSWPELVRLIEDSDKQSYWTIMGGR